MDSRNKETTIAFLGDSITAGIGKKTISFVDVIQRQYATVNFKNYAFSGTTIDYIDKVLQDVLSLSPSHVFICYGNVDVMIKPKRAKIFYSLPQRYQINNGNRLGRRAFFSSSFKKRTLQRIEEVIKTCIRKTIVLFEGTEQWNSVMSFEEKLEKYCNLFSSNSIVPIIVSTVYIDDSFFPGSNEEYKNINQLTSNYAKMNGFIFVDIYSELLNCVQNKGWDYCYSKDHFHPNNRGNRIIAKKLIETMERESVR
jgi:lysophospholipase L1-like esterase